MLKMYETDTQVFGQEDDQVRALGLLTIMASTTPTYAQDQLFRFTQTVSYAVEVGQYGILYERADKDAINLVPVAFCTWGFFSQTVGMIFENRLRFLQKTDYQSGGHMWLLDIVAPFGHLDDLTMAVSSSVGEDHDEYFVTRLKGDKMVRAKIPNKLRKASVDEPKDTGLISSRTMATENKPKLSLEEIKRRGRERSQAWRRNHK